MPEKSTQVSMMHRIYSQSSYVVAWVGPEDEHTEAGLRAIRTLSKHVDQIRDSNIKPYDGTDGQNYQDAGVPVIPCVDWNGLASIYQRQWFRRSWIAQEAILPDVVIMYRGTHQLSHHDLGIIASILGHNYGKLSLGFSLTYVPTDEIAVTVEWHMGELFKLRDSLYFSRAADTEDEREARRENFQLQRLIHNFETFLVSDPRDKIFALYVIINQTSEKRMVANYQQPTNAVFTVATRRIIQQSGDISIICPWTNMAERRPGLPSWVPDYQLVTGDHIRDYDVD